MLPKVTEENEATVVQACSFVGDFFAKIPQCKYQFKARVHWRSLLAKTSEIL